MIKYYIFLIIMITVNALYPIVIVEEKVSKKSMYLWQNLEYTLTYTGDADKFKPEGWGVYEGPGRSFFTGAVMKLSFYDKETCDAYMKFVIEEETRRKNDIDPSEFTLNNTIREEHQLSNLFDPTAMEVMPVGEFDKFANRIMKSPMEVINYYIDPNQTERRGQKK